MRKNYIFLLAFLTICVVGAEAQTLGYAICFDGVNDFAPVYRSSETGIFGTNANNDSFTIEFWVKDNGNGGKHMYSKHYDSGTAKEGYFIERDATSGFVTAGIANNTNNWTTVTGTRAINDGNWHHVAVTFDITIGRLMLYVDGHWEATANGITPVFGNTVDARLSSSEHENTFFGGAFDEVRVWNTIRTASEINIGMNMEVATNSTGLVQYFKCNEGIPDTDNWILYQLVDHTGNGRPGDLWNVFRLGTCSNWVHTVSDSVLSTETFEALTEGLTLYPNPANSIIKINGLRTTVDYQIYNMLGAVVKTGNTTNNEVISIDNLRNGMYFLKLSDNRTIKFIKR
ncbi:concanavalin A-like lectin/glucanases superfamily protein [Kordia sp. SMS9]|uniref:LamG-like jellyroll fold domain-containing protein n=1 Tax=Kordia sp. SMS9 TaxID=2282170 RepID=UPI000E0D18DB|nr:LamG-like jellyroll fold domain-containing protein [Kordia sp. SMS9]AXG69302.1 concanavalin A-like lectin/glucanases superfamily protein [Kordia sp. SMS9]